MKARLFLILIFTTLLVVLLTNGSSDLIPAKEILVFDKKITLNTELTISLIVLSALLGVFFIGVIERLFLILIFIALLVVLLTNGSSDLIPPRETLVFDKKITLNTELIISLIILFTLLGIFSIGVIERLFFSKGKEKRKKQ